MSFGKSGSKSDLPKKLDLLEGYWKLFHKRVKFRLNASC